MTDYSKYEKLAYNNTPTKISGQRARYNGNSRDQQKDFVFNYIREGYGIEKIVKELGISKRTVYRHIETLKNDIINLRRFVTNTKDYKWMTVKECQAFHNNQRLKQDEYDNLKSKGKTIDEIEKIMKIDHQILLTYQNEESRIEQERESRKLKESYDMLEGIKKYGPSQEMKLASKTLQVIEKNLDSAPEEVKSFIVSCMQIAKIKEKVGY